jgi:anti-anti-sigma factor
MAELRIQSQTLTGNTVLCKIAGDVNGENFDTLEGECNTLIESGVVGVLADLTGLQSVTSAGLGALLNLGQVLSSRGGRLVCAGAGPGVLRTVEMLGIQEALTLQDTPDAGRKALAAAVK